MRAAQRAAVTDPRITLWAELAVVAHLTGWDMPRPAPAFTASLRAMDDRLRDCALSHAADAAVAARVPAISTRVSPAALAAHVAARHAAGRRPTARQGARRRNRSTSRRRTGGRWSGTRCGPPPRPARGGTRAAASGSAPTASRSPAAPPAQQTRAVARWYARDQRDTQAVATVIWGTRPRPAIEQAVGCRAGDPGWPAQLAEMLTAFARSPWPRALLRRSPPRSQATRKQAADELRRTTPPRPRNRQPPARRPATAPVTTRPARAPDTTGHRRARSRGPAPHPAGLPRRHLGRQPGIRRGRPKRRVRRGPRRAHGRRPAPGPAGRPAPRPGATTPSTTRPTWAPNTTGTSRRSPPKTSFPPGRSPAPPPGTTTRLLDETDLGAEYDGDLDDLTAEDHTRRRVRRRPGQRSSPPKTSSRTRHRGRRSCRHLGRPSSTSQDDRRPDTGTDAPARASQIPSRSRPRGQ